MTGRYHTGGQRSCWRPPYAAGGLPVCRGQSLQGRPRQLRQGATTLFLLAKTIFGIHLSPLVFLLLAFVAAVPQWVPLSASRGREREWSSDLCHRHDTRKMSAGIVGCCRVWNTQGILYAACLLHLLPAPQYPGMMTGDRRCFAGVCCWKRSWREFDYESGFWFLVPTFRCSTTGKGPVPAGRAVGVDPGAGGRGEPQPGPHRRLAPAGHRARRERGRHPGA